LCPEEESEMKKLIIGSLFSIVSAVLCAQTEDAVLLRVGNREVLRSEFEYAYHKNKVQNKMLLTDFIQSFIHLKLQALEAENRGLDTLPSFREQMKLLSLQFDRKSMEPCSFVSKKYVSQPRLAHLFIYLPQSASSRTIRMACDRMDSIYHTVLSSGQTFESCVQKYIDHPSGGVCGEKTVLPTHHTMEEVEQRVRQLKVGELSRPFVSPVGVHIVQVLQRGEEHAEDEAVEIGLSGSDKTRDYLWTEWREFLLREALNADEECRDILPEQLASYFKKYKKKYAWELPHYKGGILYCKDKSSSKVVKKLLKHVPMDQWPVVVEDYNRTNPAKEVMVETGLFRIGTNPAVDKVVFRQGTFLPSSDFPYVTAVGKKLKKGPESYWDVRKLVEDDYKAFRRSEEIAGWLKKYKVEINQEVLKTVNNH